MFAAVPIDAAGYPTATSLAGDIPEIGLCYVLEVADEADFGCC